MIMETPGEIGSYFAYECLNGERVKISCENGSLTGRIEDTPFPRSVEEGDEVTVEVDGDRRGVSGTVFVEVVAVSDCEEDAVVGDVGFETMVVKDTQGKTESLREVEEVEVIE